MMTDTEIRLKGVQVLAEYLGDVEAERFIALIQREPRSIIQSGVKGWMKTYP